LIEVFALTFFCSIAVNFGPAKEPWKAGEEKIKKFVFIGKGLDRKELTDSLMECLYKEEKDSSA
jgi:hypothetical protein